MLHAPQLEMLEMFSGNKNILSDISRQPVCDQYKKLSAMNLAFHVTHYTIVGNKHKHIILIIQKKLIVLQ